VTSGRRSDVIVTLGNDFRGDDGAGVLFGRLVSGRTDATVIEGGDTPENITGLIVDAKPGRIIIVDAMDFGGKPGESICVPGGKLEGAGISTHGSLKLFVEYVERETGAEVLVLGIQPESVGLGKEMSVRVFEAVSELARRLTETGDVESILS